MYKVGDIIFAFVTGIERYGFFVNTEDGFSGLVHISEISSDYVKNVNDYVREGELIKAKVLDVDVEKRQLKLSVKDFDYRVTRKRKNKIIETSLGFSSLEKMLPIWISEKEEKLAGNYGKEY